MSFDTPSRHRSELGARRDTPPSRWRVFGELWWRSWALAIAGGCVVGFVGGPLFVIAWRGTEEIPTAFVAAPFGGFVGAAFGFGFGLLAALVMGAIGAIWLVPYRGKLATRWALRGTGVTCVVFMMQMMFLSGDADLITAVIVIPSLVGAWWISPWAGSWYTTWMGEAPAGSEATDANPR